VKVGNLRSQKVGELRGLEGVRRNMSCLQKWEGNCHVRKCQWTKPGCKGYLETRIRAQKLRQEYRSSWKKKSTENGEKYVNIVINIRISEAYHLLQRRSLML
jgi:hypothetical protein